MAGVVQKAKDFYSSGLMGKLFTFCKGRNTFFALVFTAAGIVLAFEGKLTMQYVALVGAIQTLIVAHSVKEDWHTQQMKDSAASSQAATVIPRIA